MTTWPPQLSRRDEKLRAALGLTAKVDGWYKSIDGKTRYLFKPMPVREAAKALDQRIAEIRLKAAGVPAAKVVRATELTVEAVAEAYTAWMFQRLTTGVPRRLSRRTYDDVVRVLDVFLEIVGPDVLANDVGPDQFSAFARKRFAGRAASSIRREIIYLEAFARWASPGVRHAGLLAKPWQFGPDLAKPPLDRVAVDIDKSYSVADLKRAFRAVRKSPLYRAVGLLGLNCAFSARDCSTLPQSAVDLDAAVIRFARGKTGVSRLCVLWQRTVRALQAYLAVRPDACDASAAGMFFRTRNGLPYARHSSDTQDAGTAYDGIGNRWHKLTGLPFSGLRATFATAADDWPDQRAVDLVMGHRSHESVRSRHYARRFDISRIKKLVVHVWPRVLGRKLQGSVPSAVAETPAPAADTAATQATAGNQQGRSGIAGGRSQAAARPPLATRRRESRP